MMRWDYTKKYSKSCIFILTLLITTGAFSACGKADRDDIAKDLSENVTYTATEDDAVHGGIPKNLSYTIVSGGKGIVKVEAEVYSEGCGQNVPTYKLQKKDKNDAWIRSYAEKLFDNGEYVNIKPYDVCSREELETEKQLWEEQLMELSESDRGYDRVKSEIDSIEHRMEGFSERDYVEYPEDQLIFKYNFSVENITGYFEDAQLRGEVDGDVWRLNYSYSMNWYEGEKPKNSNATILYGSCLEKMDRISHSYKMEDEKYKNKCDRETAESEARRLLEQLGFQNMECVNMTQLQPEFNGEKADYLDGYRIIYGPSFNGITMFSCMWCGVDTGGENVAVQPYVYVLVNSEGVYSFCIMEDYAFDGMLSENSQMLSFEMIDDIAHREFEKMLEENPDTGYDITKVQFEYVCVTYDGINYAMLPVWTYYCKYFRYNLAYISPFLTVNALDGSVISLAAVNCNWEYYYIE